MIGYDTHGPQYPTEWDEPETEDPIEHWMIEPKTACKGEMRTFWERREGVAIRTTYYCSECSAEYTDDYVVHALEGLEVVE